MRGFLYTNADGSYTVPDYELAKERIEDAVENEADFVVLKTLQGWRSKTRPKVIEGIFNVSNIDCLMCETGPLLGEEDE